MLVHASQLDVELSEDGSEGEYQDQVVQTNRISHLFFGIFI